MLDISELFHCQLELISRKSIALYKFSTPFLNFDNFLLLQIQMHTFIINNHDN